MRLPRLFLITAFLVWTGALSPVQASSLSASKDSAKVRTGRWFGNVELVSGFGFLNWKEITKIGMFRNNSLYLSCEGKRYELRRKGGFSLIKYFSLWRVLADKPLA